MPTTTVHTTDSYDVLRFEINDGTQKRTMYIGSMPAQDLDKYSEVPSFKNTTPHDAIANSLKQTHVTDWQRPLNVEKRKSLTERYNQAGEFMPNPVLLSAQHDPNFRITANTSQNGVPTGLYTLEIDHKAESKPPLMILDGQHRISGLAQTLNPNPINNSWRGEPIPFVLLFSNDVTAYKGNDFAKIFAEVSTGATPLHPIHGEWMQYAFDLGSYAPTAPNPHEHKEAMKVAISLCDTAKYGIPGVTQIDNPFKERIQFNPELELPTSAPLQSGFRFTAQEVKEFVRKEYYGKPSSAGNHLAADAVAEQVARATLTLVSLMQNKIANCFIGTKDYRHTYMQHAFVGAVLSKLLNNQTPNWSTIVQNIYSSTANLTADWDFTSWVRTTGGNDGNSSRIIAHNVMTEAIDAADPHSGAPNFSTFLNGAADLPAFLQGNGAEISFVSAPSPKRSSNTNKYTYHSVGASGSQQIFLNGDNYLKFLPKKKTSNLHQVKIRNNGSHLQANKQHEDFKKWVPITKQVSLRVESILYGGREAIVQITVIP